MKRIGSEVDKCVWMYIQREKWDSQCLSSNTYLCRARRQRSLNCVWNPDGRGWWQRNQKRDIKNVNREESMLSRHLLYCVWAGFRCMTMAVPHTPHPLSYSVLWLRFISLPSINMKSHAYLAFSSINTVIFKGYFKTSIYLNRARRSQRGCFCW